MAVISKTKLRQSPHPGQGSKPPVLRRWKLPVPQVLEHLVGMQAQEPNDPYFGLRTRLEGFRPEGLARLITGRRAVRDTLMRTTIHLVTARDFLALYPVMQPVHVRTVYSSSPERRALEFAAPGARDHRVRIAPAD